MPTVVGHALVGSSLFLYVRPWLPESWRRVGPLLGGVLAMAPDADVAGFRFGIAYGDHFGHRGFSHSLVAASLFGALGVARLWIYSRTKGKTLGQPDLASTAWVFLLMWLAVASHPLLDMMTNGGLGCALLAPFSWSRMFWSWTPIPVSPIGLSPEVAPVLAWEMAFFLPLFLSSIGVHAFRSRFLRASALGVGVAGTVGAVLFRVGF